MIPLLAASRRPHGILLATALLILAAGCKPKAAPTNDQISASSPSDRPSSVEAGSAPRSPTVAELTSFLRSVSPPVMRVVEVKMEPPARMEMLSYKYPRLGYRKLTRLLRREGWQAGRKLVQRIRRECDLRVKRWMKRPRRRGCSTGTIPTRAERVNHVWSWDFHQ